MTAEEVNQLKPGDYVSAVFKVTTWDNGNILDGEGYTKLIPLDSLSTDEEECTYLHSSCLQKAEKPRRKFKEEDIVRVTEDSPIAAYVVREDECDSTVKIWGEAIGLKYINADKLTLICAVENRDDMNN